jgi:hypothetical protein
MVAPIPCSNVRVISDELAPANPESGDGSAVARAPRPQAGDVRRLRALAEKFRLHQSSAGLPAPHVVQTMAEAGRLLGLGSLVFEPVDTSWLANDEAKVL